MLPDFLSLVKTSKLAYLLETAEGTDRLKHSSGVFSFRPSIVKCHCKYDQIQKFSETYITKINNVYLIQPIIWKSITTALNFYCSHIKMSLCSICFID